MLYILVFTRDFLSFWLLHEIWRCIGVARFDNQGNAKAFMAWNEWQDRLHAFRIYKRVDFVNEGVSWLHLLTELEWTFYETIHIAC